MNLVTNGLYYYHFQRKINEIDNIVHIVKYEQYVNTDLTLLISKVSEAINPLTLNNHIGEGSNLNQFLKKQTNVRFVINGGFSHYRKNFYEWPHQNFNVGDPVGLIKIRDHYFQDYINLNYYGFLIQETKEHLWKIVEKNNITQKEKYILGCTPLLIFNKKNINIPQELMTPLNQKVNPPSILGHGLENHSRTAVGFKGKDIFFLLVEGSKFNKTGCSLIELQKIGNDLNLDSLLNLDGGGSSQFRLYHQNNYIKNNIDKHEENRILGHVLTIFDKSLM